MKAGKDLYSKLGLVHLVDAASQSAGVVKSALVDTAGLNGVMIIVNLGAYTAGTGTGVTAKLVEGDTTADGSLTDVAAADYLVDSLTLCTDGNNDCNSKRFVYIGNKRYVGINITVTSGSTSALLSADAIVAYPITEPITAPAATARS